MKGGTPILILSNCSQDRARICTNSALPLSFLSYMILSPINVSPFSHTFSSLVAHLSSVNPTRPTSKTHPHSGLAGLRFIPVDLCQAVILQYCSVQEV